jgi:hypothetical protein
VLPWEYYEVELYSGEISSINLQPDTFEFLLIGDTRKYAIPTSSFVENSTIPPKVSNDDNLLLIL